MAKKESPKLKSEEVTPVLEPFELLVSDEYELTRPIPTHVYRYGDGTVVIRSLELNLYGQGYTDYEARRDFSLAVIEEFEELREDIEQGVKLGPDLQVRLSLLGRLLKRVER